MPLSPGFHARMTETPQPVLSFEGVSLTYRGGELPVEALRGVDLAVSEAGFTAIMGPSGSGKSTLLNLAAGLLTPTEGRIVAFGRDLGGLDEDARTRLLRERMGMVFQFFNLVPALSVRDNVELPLWIRSRMRFSTGKTSMSRL